MFESGIHDQQLKWSLQFLSEANRKIEDNPLADNKSRPLTLSRNLGILVLLAGGVVLASIVFVLEILWKFTISFTMQKRNVCRRRHAN